MTFNFFSGHSPKQIMSAGGLIMCTVAIAASTFLTVRDLFDEDTETGSFMIDSLLAQMNEGMNRHSDGYYNEYDVDLASHTGFRF